VAIAFNVSSMTPDVLLPEAMQHHSLEHILPHRRNRYLGVSVEGNVSFSWLTEDSNLQFECVTWPKVQPPSPASASVRPLSRTSTAG
jgi:hypothetical protein